MGRDLVWGISNVAVVWRGPRMALTGNDQSSFIDTYPGYQLAVMGVDYRSDGGTAPWLATPMGVLLNVGLFPEDPTTTFPPSVAVQATAITTDMPRLFR